jgi:uncharacterized membrane protein (UPF0127 family)
MKLIKNKTFLSIFILLIILCLFLIWTPAKKYFGFSGLTDKSLSVIDENLPILAKNYEKISLKINNVIFQSFVADTNEKRLAGLSNWDNLPQNYAMFFIFSKPDYQGIWMKDMKMPLDILWLDENGKIIYLQQNISPATYPKIFTPDSLSLYVIELPAGTILQNKINLGMTVSVI